MFANDMAHFYQQNVFSCQWIAANIWPELAPEIRERYKQEEMKIKNRLRIRPQEIVQREHKSIGSDIHFVLGQWLCKQGPKRIL